MSAKTSESIDSPTSRFHQVGGGGGIAALIITLCHRNRNEITQLYESISNFTFKLYSFHTTCVLHRRDLQIRPSNRLERENEIFLGDQSLFITWVGWKREFLEGLGDQVVFMRKRRETSVVANKVWRGGLKKIDCKLKCQWKGSIKIIQSFMGDQVKFYCPTRFIMVHRTENPDRLTD